MSKLRVYDLAKKYNIPSKDFVGILNKYNIPVKNHMSALTDQQITEFEEKFDAQKLTSIMNYPDIYKEVYVQVAQWIYGRSAQLVAASLTGLIMLLKSYNKEIRRTTVKV